MRQGGCESVAVRARGMQTGVDVAADCLHDQSLTTESLCWGVVWMSGPDD